MTAVRPVPLGELAQHLGASFGRMELPVVYVIARFHAGCMWVAPIGTEPPEPGSAPGPEWIEVAVHG